MWKLKSRLGVPRTACTATAPSPWSKTSTRKPGSASRRYATMPPSARIARGGLRVSNETSARRCARIASITGASLAGSGFSIDVGMQPARHSVQPDEAFGLLDTPVRGLCVRGLRASQDVRRLDDDRVDRRAARLERDRPVDVGLARFEVRLEVGLERLVEEALVDELRPLRADRRLEAVLRLRSDRFLERAVRDVERGERGGFVDDAALEADRRIARVEPASDAVAREIAVEPLEDRRPVEPLAV